MELHLEQVAAHYAISSVFSSFADETDLFCFHIRRHLFEIHTSGRGRLALGRVHVASAITGHAQSFSFAVLHFGDQNITAAVKAYNDSDAAAFEASPPRSQNVCSAPTSPMSFVLSTVSTVTLITRSVRSSATNSAASSSSSSTPPSGTSRIHSPPSTRITQACCIISRRQVCPSRLRSPSPPVSPSMRACAACLTVTRSTSRSCALISRSPRLTRSPLTPQRSPTLLTSA